MIFYDMIFTASQNLTDSTLIQNIFGKKSYTACDSKTLLNKINQHLDNKCSGQNFMAQAYEVKGELLHVACYYNCTTLEQQNISQTLVEILQELLMANIATHTIEEITTNVFYEKVKIAEGQSNYQKESTNGEESWAEDFNPDVLESAHFETSEYVLEKTETSSNIASELQAHYKITAHSLEKTKEIVESLVSNAKLQNRIIGTRTTFVKLNNPRINNSFEAEVDALFAKACGTTMVIDLSCLCLRKNVPNSVRDLNQELWNAFEKNILKHAEQILFVFVVTDEISPNTKEVLVKLAEKLKIADITG